MKPFDLLNTPLEGSSLIEASAGTGKTYNIEGLFIRLILEMQLQVDQILVLTFTNAATEELKDRIRNKLVEAKDAFAAGGSDDALIDSLVKTSPTLKRRACEYMKPLLISIKQLSLPFMAFASALFMRMPLKPTIYSTRNWSQTRPV